MKYDSPTFLRDSSALALSVVLLFGIVRAAIIPGHKEIIAIGITGGMIGTIALVYFAWVHFSDSAAKLLLIVASLESPPGL